MNLHYTTQFKKDYKRIKKQNKDLAKLRAVIEKLVAGQLLEPKYKDHQSESLPTAIGLVDTLCEK